jgi:hypothetical protein
MSLVAISTGISILALIGLAAGLALALVVVALFNRVVRPALEIRAYATDINETAGRIAANLEGVEELARTRELTAAMPELAGAYLERVKGMLR